MLVAAVVVTVAGLLPNPEPKMGVVELVPVPVPIPNSGAVVAVDEVTDSAINNQIIKFPK